MDYNYKYIFFDLDGTLTDPAIGITNGIMHALRHFGIEVEDRSVLYPFIGPPLASSFVNFYGFSEEKAAEAVEVYRSYFGVTGLFENEVYPGILQMLRELKSAGKHLCLATSKPTCYSVRIMEHFGMAPYFDEMIGSNLDGSCVDKDEIIRLGLQKCGVTDLSQAVMVGDRKFDIIGGQKCGIATIGVLYGYGTRTELEENGADIIAATVEDLQKILLR